MKINWFKIDIEVLGSNIGTNIFTGDISLLENIATYLKIGEWCEDCNQHFRDCRCDICECCRYKICAKIIDTKNQVRKYLKNIIPKILSKYYINEILKITKKEIKNEEDIKFVISMNKKEFQSVIKLVEYLENL